MIGFTLIFTAGLTDPNSLPAEVGRVYVETRNLDNVFGGTLVLFVRDMESLANKRFGGSNITVGRTHVMVEEK